MKTTWWPAACAPTRVAVHAVAWFVLVWLSIAVFTSTNATARAEEPDPTSDEQQQHPEADVPRPLTAALEAMAGELALTLEDRPPSRIAVLEFVTETPQGEVLGGEFGLLGRFCSESMAKRLAGRESDSIEVVDPRRLAKALEETEFSIHDLHDPEALQRLAKHCGGATTFVVGRFQGREERVLTLECGLLDAQTGDTWKNAKAVVRLSDSEWAMLGRSAQRAIPTGISPSGEGIDSTEVAIAELDRLAEEDHPMSDPEFPFPIHLVIDGQKRAPVFHGNDCFVPVRSGEVFQIHLENRADRVVGMRILVDGLNTLPEMHHDRNVRVVESLARPNLDGARPWILDPQIARRYALKGFVTDTTAIDFVDFAVSELEPVIAGRHQFASPIGMITAATYEPSQTHDSEDFRRRFKDFRRLLSVVHLQLIDVDLLEDVKRDWAEEPSGN